MSDADVSPDKIAEFFQIVGETKAEQVAANFEVLAEHNIFTTDIEEHMLVLKRGNAEQMGETLDILERFEIGRAHV